MKFLIKVYNSGADPGGVLGVRKPPPPPFGGPPKFIKRVKNVSCVSVLVLTVTQNPPFRNPVSAPVIRNASVCGCYLNLAWLSSFFLHLFTTKPRKMSGKKTYLMNMIIFSLVAKSSSSRKAAGSH